MTLAAGKLERCAVCGGPLAPLCTCSHCSITHPPEVYTSGRTWNCPKCFECLPIQFTCKNCGTRYLYEEAVKKSADDAVPLKQEAPKAPETPKKPIHRRPPRRLKGEFSECDIKEIARLPGISVKRAEQLCRAGFTSISKIKGASQDVLSAVPGIGPELAKSIKSTTNLILLLPRRRSREEMFEEERECSKCGLPAPVFSDKCLDCGSTFEAEELDEASRREFKRLGVEAIIEYYGRVLHKAADDVHVWHALSLALNQAGRLDAARKAVRKARKLDPENPKLRDLEEKLKYQIKPTEAQTIKAPPEILKKSVEPLAMQVESPKKVVPIAEPEVSKPSEIPLEKPAGIAEKEPEEVPPRESLGELKGQAEKVTLAPEKEPPSVKKAPEVSELLVKPRDSVEVPAPELAQTKPVITLEQPIISQIVDRARSPIMSGRRPLQTGYGLVNGRGRVNGLINGNGFINGGTVSEVALPRGNIAHRYLAVAAFLLAIFLIVNTSLQLRAPPGKSIQIDGSFGDWQPMGAYHDATDSSNPDTNLVSYALKLEGQSLFFMARVGGTLFADTVGYDSFFIFFDVDDDDSTGYLCGSLGADNAVMVDGYNSSVIGASLQTFGGQDRSDWNEWVSTGAIRIAVSGDGIEGELQTALLSWPNPDRLLAMFVVDDQEGGVSRSAVAIGLNYGVLKVSQRGLTQLLPTGPRGFLELTFEAVGPQLTLMADDLVISHTPNTQVNGMPSSITIIEGNQRVITLTIDASVIATGSVVEASLESVMADRPVTIVGSGARAYVLSPPAGFNVDGLFAEWAAPHIDPNSPPLQDTGVDIDAYDVNASGDTVFFYLRTVTDPFEGSITPKHQQRVSPSPGAGGGVSPRPRLSGENTARVFIESNSSVQDGFPIGGILADYMVEAKGQYGSIHAMSMYQWQDRWVIIPGAPRIAIMANEAEISASIAGLDLTNASCVFETRNWRNAGDETTASGTRDGGNSGTRGTYNLAMGTYTHLYALPTSDSPNIDGQWDSSEWADADSYISDDMEVYTMQNGADLYLAIRVKSDSTYNVADYAEIAFDTDNEGEGAPQPEDKKFDAVGPDGSAVIDDYNGDGSGWDPDYSSSYAWDAEASKDPEDSYITYEFAIPFPEVWNTPNPSAGQTAGLAVHAYDADGPSDYYWGTTDLNNLANFGDLDIPEFEEVAVAMLMIMAIAVSMLRRSGKNNKPKGH